MTLPSFTSFPSSSDSPAAQCLEILRRLQRDHTEKEKKEERSPEEETKTHTGDEINEVNEQTTRATGPTPRADSLRAESEERAPAHVPLSAPRVPHIGLELNLAILRKVLGRRWRHVEAIAEIELEIIAAIRQYLHQAATDLGPGPLLVRGHPLADWLGIDAVATLLSARPEWTAQLHRLRRSTGQP